MAIDYRRKARTVALQVLYEVDCTGHDVQVTLGRALHEAALPEEAVQLATQIAVGVAEKRASLDEVIVRHAPQWPVDELSVVDRNVFRIAIYEISFNNETTFKVVINEAVELAKAFGSLNIYRFINGVLGSVVEDAVTNLGAVPGSGNKQGSLIPGGSSGDRI